MIVRKTYLFIFSQYKTFSSQSMLSLRLEKKSAIFNQGYSYPLGAEKGIILSFSCSLSAAPQAIKISQCDLRRNLQKSVFLQRLQHLLLVKQQTTRMSKYRLNKG